MLTKPPTEIVGKNQRGASLPRYATLTTNIKEPKEAAVKQNSLPFLKMNQKKGQGSKIFFYDP